MRGRGNRVLVVVVVIVALAVAAGTGALVFKGTSPPSSTAAATSTTTTTTIDPICEQNAPTNGCPLGTPAAIAWEQQQDQAAQAAQAAATGQAEQAEQAYEQCLANEAAAIADEILQEFGKVNLGTTPTYETCSTAGLTPAQIQQAQAAEGMGG